MTIHQSLLSLLTVGSWVTCNGQLQTNSWMKQMSTGAASSYYDFDIFTGTIFDVVLPGAANAGMYDDAVEEGTRANSEEYEALDVDNSVHDLTAAQIAAWSGRQRGNVLDTLNAGARFLELQFEYDGTTFKSYSVNYGANASTVAAAVNSFVNNATSNEEIVILYFNNGTNADGGGSLDGLYTIFSDELGSLLVPNSVDLTTETIEDLVTAGTRVIAIAEDPGTSSFFDAEGLVTSFYTNPNDADDLRTDAVGSLRNGWEYDQLYLLPWTIAIDDSTASIAFDFFTDFYYYSRDANVELSSTIESFPKLRFGNVIYVDYFESSDVLDLAIRLTYEYATCNDDNTYWGTDAGDCPTGSNLANTYGSEGVPQECITGTTGSMNTSEVCQRSCGRCGYVGGTPGAECSTDADCDSPIYESAAGASGATGICWRRSDNADYDNLVTEDSFCQAYDAYEACKSVEEENDCATGGSTINIDTCEDFCSSNYQCETGYCSTQFGICMTTNASSIETTPAPVDESQRYDFVKSETAEIFLADIEGLRPGDPNGAYEINFNVQPGSFEEDNPYLTSVVGFVLVPFIISIILMFFYCWTCMFWCLPCCEPCCKKCCCRMCLGTEPDENPVAKWAPCGILAAVMCVIIWASIEGIVYNSLLHDHLFAYSPNGGKDSVKQEIFDLADEIEDLMKDVPGLARDLVDVIVDIVDYTANAITSTKELDESTDTIQAALKDLDDKWAGEQEFSATVNDPFNRSGPSESYPFTCTFCVELETTIETLNETVVNQFAGGIETLLGAFNLTDYLNQFEGEIDEQLDSFSETINSLINDSDAIRTDAEEVFDLLEGIDSQYREPGGFIFFSVPFVWCVFPIIGIFLGKWCFKLNWCIAMWLGALIMFLSTPFVLLTVTWADLCVRLDDFEQNFGKSDLGQQLADITDANLTGQLYSVVNACFTGDSLLEQFDLDELLDLDQFKDEFNDALNLDIASVFESDDFLEFETEIALVDTSEFTSETTSQINALNAFDLSYCFCPVIDRNTSFAFTKDLILNYSCSSETSLNRSYPASETDFYWSRIFDDSEGGSRQEDAITCISLYTTAFGYAFAEQNLTSTFEEATEDIKAGGDRIAAAVANMTNFASRIDRVLKNVSCDVNDLFDDVDELIAQYTSCGFLGDAYEGFKNVGCELLFKDMYIITRSMAVISFLSIMIVCCSMCMDYVKDPMCDDDLDEIEDDYNNKVASGTGTDWNSSGQNEERPSYAVGMTQMQPGATEGPGADDGQTNTQFV